MKATSWVGLTLFASTLCIALENSDEFDLIEDENPLMNVTFEIAKGTGSGVWNSAEVPIEVCATKGKATITYLNSDTVQLQIHTNGVPHNHSDAIQPGEAQKLVINTNQFDNTAAGSPNNMYDHGFGPKTSRIYFRLVKCDGDDAY